MQNDKRVEIAEAEDKTNYPLYEEIKWHKLSFTKVFLHIFGCAITFVADIYTTYYNKKFLFQIPSWKNSVREQEICSLSAYT